LLGLGKNQAASLSKQEGKGEKKRRDLGVTEKQKPTDCRVGGNKAWGGRKKKKLGQISKRKPYRT